jgi:hypothetical protein
MSEKKPDTMAVIHRRDGVLIGTYEPNVVYTLERAEAERLIAVKGFEPASPAIKEERL